MDTCAEPRIRFIATSKGLWFVFIAVFLFSFAFAWYTNQAWEDWFITYRVSKNLALGNGMVYTMGEKIHAFTSPLGTLVPALLGFITGNRSDELVLWLFRVIGCCLLGLSAVMLVKTARATGMYLFPTLIMIGLFIFDTKTVAFSTNGMETAFMIFFLGSSFYALALPVKRFVFLLGLFWAGLMWTRPDSFVYIGGMALAWLLFNPPSPHFSSRRGMMKQFAFAGIVTTALYLPWILWAWNYFGSPVPHTVIAKGLNIDRPDIYLLQQFLIFPFIIPFWGPLDGSFALTFQPPVFINAGWPLPLVYGGTILAMLGAYAWVLPAIRPQTRAVSFMLLVVHFYLYRFPGSVHYVFWWYMPPVAFLTFLVIGQVLQQTLKKMKILQKGPPDRAAVGSLAVCVRVFAGMLVLISAINTVVIGKQFKMEQEIFEDMNRRNIGIWLHSHAASPRDSVFLECLGYIGYYSQLKMLDFPGLASPEVVRARTELQTDEFAPLIRYLKPDWVVLRQSEVSTVLDQMPLLLSVNYEQARVFDVSEEIRSRTPSSNSQLYESDRKYIIYKKKQF